MKKLLACVCAALAALTSPAYAGPLMKYDYADVAYQWYHFDDSAFDTSNGVDARLSYSPLNHFALEGGYEYGSASGSDFSGNINTHMFNYGGLGFYELCNGLNLLARVGGLHARANYDGDTVSDNGMYAGAGLRYQLTEKLEGNFDATWSRINTGSWNFPATLFYAIADHVALKGQVSINSDADVGLLAGLRFTL